MTVKQLIQQLQKVNQDAKILICSEGWACDIHQVYKERDKEIILLGEYEE